MKQFAVVAMGAGIWLGAASLTHADATKTPAKAPSKHQETQTTKPSTSSGPASAVSKTGAQTSPTPSATTTTKNGATSPVDLSDAPAKIAVAYLKSLSGKGDLSAREYLLGGLTLTAEEYSIPAWRIVGREPMEREVNDVKDAVREMRALDAAGRKTLSGVVNVSEDDLDIQAISQEQAEKIMAPTQEAAKKFEEKYPTFAYCARVNKDVYWHPSNPWRATVLPALVDGGTYTLELHRFRVEESVPGREPRVWPLRVLRIKTATYDSGYKILPASDWDPEY